MTHLRKMMLGELQKGQTDGFKHRRHAFRF